MKMLLTAAGIKNPSLHTALVDLLDKPIAACTALAIPTAGYGHPMSTPDKAYSFLTGQATTPMTELGWESVGVLELTALPSIDRDRWLPWVRAADVFLVNGGDALYLAHWMRTSGLVDLLPELDAVWCGLSGGSMVMTPRVGPDFIGWQPPDGSDRALGLVDFAICPHLAPDGEPGNSMAEAEAWAATLDVPAYAIDDQTGFSVVDGEVEVVSEGVWRRFPR